MPKMSVKKPFTVLVMVASLILLGYVSLTKMQMDLLPKINLPYILVVTTYPGASPEKVESTVCEPLEANLGTISGVKNVFSISYENYGIVELEFEDGTDLDSVMVKVSTAIDTTSAAFPEECGTPSIMELSTDMMANEYVAVSYEGKDITELSDFVNEVVKPELERQDGVASISTTGLISETVSIDLDQKKVDELNDKILIKANDALDEAMEQLDDAKSELEKAQKELNDGKQELKDGEQEIADNEQKIKDGQKELDDAEKELDDAKEELKDKQEETYKELATASENLEALETYQAQLVSQEASLKAAEMAIDTINEKMPSSSERQQMESGLTQMSDAIDRMNTAIEALEECKEGINGNDDDLIDSDAMAIRCLSGARTAIEGINDSLSSSGQQGLPVNDIDPGSMSYSQAKGEIEGYITGVGAVKSGLVTKKSQLESAKSGLEKAEDLKDKYETEKASLELEVKVTKEIIKKYESALEDLGVTYTSIEEAKMKASSEFAAADAQIKDGENTIESNRKQLESAMDTIDSAREQLTSGWEQIDDGQKQIDDGWEQYYDGLEEFEKQKESTLKKANADALLTLDTLSGLVYAQNFEMPAGYIDDKNSNSWLLKIGDNFDSLDEMENMVLCNIDGVGDVHLKDVANITIINNADTTYTKLGTEDSVILSIFKASTAGTNDVSKACNKAIDKLEKKYDGLNIMIMMDQGDYIEMIVGNVVNNMVIGAILAIIILAIFLKDVMPTIVVAISIPLSVLTCLVCMYFSGISLNMMSLSGMALGIGMLVDNSIVVIENIYRLRGRGVEAPRAAVQGTRQVAGSVISSTLTTVCVFVPMVFTTGLVRELMLPMSLTIIYCLLASLFIAMTVVPAASSTLLRKTKPKKHPLFDKVQDVYGKVLGFFLKVKIIPLTAAFGLLILSVWLVLRMGIVMVPNMVSNQVQATITFDEDAKREDVYKQMDVIIEDITAIDGVGSVGIMTGDGSSLFADMGQDDFRTYSVMITTEDENAGAGVVEGINSALEEIGKKHGVELKIEQTMSMDAMLGSGLSISVYGDDMDKLLGISEDIMDIVGQVKGFTEISNGQEAADQVLHLNIDKDYAMSKGLSVAQIYQELAGKMTTSKQAITVTINGKDMEVQVVNDLDPITVENILDYTFTVQNTDSEGKVTEEEIKLKEFAKMETQDGYSAINRKNQTRYITISAAVEDGYNTALLSRKLQPLLDKYDMPDGYSMEVGGETESVNEMVTQMSLLIAMGIAFIYFVMVAQFQSLLSPFIVIFTLPLAFTGGMLVLWATGEQISIIAIMGFIVLLGTVVNNGIVFVDYTNQLRKGGMERHAALIATGKTRMRPILMTALTTILAESSMIFGDDMGSQMGRGMALVIAGGLAYSTLMTLFIIPVMYDILFKKAPLDVDLGSENLDDVPDDAKEFMEQQKAAMGLQLAVVGGGTISVEDEPRKGKAKKKRRKPAKSTSEGISLTDAYNASETEDVSLDLSEEKNEIQDVETGQAEENSLPIQEVEEMAVVEQTDAVDLSKIHELTDSEDNME